MLHGLHRSSSFAPVALAIGFAAILLASLAFTSVQPALADDDSNSSTTELLQTITLGDTDTTSDEEGEGNEDAEQDVASVNVQALEALHGSMLERFGDAAFSIDDFDVVLGLASSGELSGTDTASIRSALEEERAAGTLTTGRLAKYIVVLTACDDNCFELMQELEGKVTGNETAEDAIWILYAYNYAYADLWDDPNAIEDDDEGNSDDAENEDVDLYEGSDEEGGADGSDLDEGSDDEDEDDGSYSDDESDVEGNADDAESEDGADEEGDADGSYADEDDTDVEGDADDANPDASDEEGDTDDEGDHDEGENDSDDDVDVRTALEQALVATIMETKTESGLFESDEEGAFEFTVKAALALLPYSESDENVDAAITSASAALAAMRGEDGGFSASGEGASDLVSTAHAVILFSALGDDADSADFATGENGPTPIDFIVSRAYPNIQDLIAEAQEGESATAEGTDDSADESSDSNDATSYSALATQAGEDGTSATNEGDSSGENDADDATGTTGTNSSETDADADANGNTDADTGDSNGDAGEADGQITFPDPAFDSDEDAAAAFAASSAYLKQNALGGAYNIMDSLSPWMRAVYKNAISYAADGQGGREVAPTPTDEEATEEADDNEKISSDSDKKKSPQKTTSSKVSKTGSVSATPKTGDEVPLGLCIAVACTLFAFTGLAFARSRS